eukprot:CAMPEP_0197904740 /NCGR_PEP_ID=MMETSP1439-20131203/58708_1 /TAXON_ID=66791 /ORGANISM="Gonyaulax spinifera, Strain CCMP409" /LENGTH=157 /DNA_ID=CAMNT_0043525953 /DNA_START=66 /DNA_END=539 /DNA_ORIENTATION=-
MSVMRSASLRQLAASFFVGDTDSPMSATDEATAPSEKALGGAQEPSLMQLPGRGKDAFARQLSEGSTVASITCDRCYSLDSDARSIGEEVSDWLEDGVCPEGSLIAVARDGTARFVDPGACAAVAGGEGRGACASEDSGNTAEMAVAASSTQPRKTV